MNACWERILDANRTWHRAGEQGARYVTDASAAVCVSDDEWSDLACRIHTRAWTWDTFESGTVEHVADVRRPDEVALDTPTSKLLYRYGSAWMSRFYMRRLLAVGAAELHVVRPSDASEWGIELPYFISPGLALIMPTIPPRHHDQFHSLDHR